MDNSASTTTDLLDRTAIVLSGLCVIHCLALPLLIIVAPFLGEFVDGHLHAQMLVIVLPLSGGALALGFRRHRNIRIVIAGVVGMLLLTLGGTIMHDQFGIVADRLFTITGAITLAVCHWFNSRAGRQCKSSSPTS